MFQGHVPVCVYHQRRFQTGTANAEFLLLLSSGKGHFGLLMHGSGTLKLKGCKPHKAGNSPSVCLSTAPLKGPLNFEMGLLASTLLYQLHHITEVTSCCLLKVADKTQTPE